MSDLITRLRKRAEIIRHFNRHAHDPADESFRLERLNDASEWAAAADEIERLTAEEERLSRDRDSWAARYYKAVKVGSDYEAERDALRALLEQCVPFIEAAVNDENVQAARNDPDVAPVIVMWTALLTDIERALGGEQHG